MLQQLLPFIPELSPRAATWGANLSCALGLSLWLAGSRFSRSFFTVSMVAAGTWAGKNLPAWFHWGVDGMAPGIGGGIALGVAAYALHGALLGAALTTLLSAWATLLTLLHTLTLSTLMNLPAWDPSSADPVAYLADLWKELPAGTHTALPIAILSVLTAVPLLAFFLPRFTAILFHTTFGLTLILAGLLIRERHTPRNLFPTSDAIQFTLIAIALLLGILFQWWLTPRRAEIATPPTEDGHTNADTKQAPSPAEPPPQGLASSLDAGTPAAPLIA